MTESPNPANDRKRPRWLLPTLAGVVGLALVGSALVVAPATAGIGRHFGPWGGHDADHVRFGVEWMLRGVDASDEQVEAIVAIAERTHDALVTGREDHHERFAALAELLSAEEIDAEALEQLRVEQVGRLEQASTLLTRSLVEVAEVLTPEQRAALIEKHERRRGHWGHRRHGFWK